MRRLRLVPFRGPRSYGDDFRASLSEVGRIDEDQAFRSLIRMLAESTAIPYETVSLELKRSLSFENEFFPDTLRLSLRSLATLPFFLLRSLLCSCKERPFVAERADVILDFWFPDADSGFYGEPLLGELSRVNKCLRMDFTALKYYRFLSAVSAFPAYFRSWLRVWRVFLVHGLDLQRFIYRFYVDYLTGKELASIGARLVLSGNDNGFPSIKALAAGAEIFLIQNGLRTYVGDTAYKYADHYASMGVGPLQDVFRECGCKLRNIHALGSLRLNNYLAGRTTAPELRYDLLFVETGYLTYFFQPFDPRRSTRWFDISFSGEATLRALQVLMDLANRSGFRIALQTMYRGEVEIIKRLGCYSDRITYFEKGDRSIYETVMESDLIMSTVSTVCLEAMGIGKRACFMNFSGNANVNRLFSSLNIEYNSESKESPEAFIRRVKSIPLDDFYAHVRQDPDYVPKLSGFVRDAVLARSRTL